MRFPAGRLFSGLLFLTALLALAACGSEPLEPSTDAGATTTTTELFSIETDASASGFSDGSATGRVVLRGSNLRTLEGDLVVDVTATNEGGVDLAEPTTLTFVSLMPEAASIRNADNGETGAGASFNLSLANNDGRWTVGETTMPRELRLDPAGATALGFVIRIERAAAATEGSIGGLVFDDADEDGVMGTAEMGVSGVAIELQAEGSQIASSVTAEDGTYRFDGLSAGLYTVFKPEQDGLVATAGNEIQVVLAADSTGVGDFLVANFACKVTSLDDPSDPVPPAVAVGDQVRVKGMYDVATGMFVVEQLHVEGRGDHHDGHDKGDGDDEDDWDDWDGWDDRDDEDDHDADDCPLGGSLRGPVTMVSTAPMDSTAGDSTVSDSTMVAPAIVGIMGVDVDVSGIEGDHDRGGGCSHLDPAMLEVGQRVRVRGSIPEDGGAALMAFRLKCWQGQGDRIWGPVQSIVLADDGSLAAITVLGIELVVPDNAFEDDGDEDDEDDDDDDHGDW